MPGGVLITNPYYVRPSATAKGQTGYVLTPLSVDLSLDNSRCSVPDGSQSETPNADSTGSGEAALSFSLCSPVASDCQTGKSGDKDKTDQSSIINSGERRPDDNGEGSPKEAQNGTIGGEDNPNIGKRKIILPAISSCATVAGTRFCSSVCRAGKQCVRLPLSCSQSWYGVFRRCGFSLFP